MKAFTHPQRGFATIAAIFLIVVLAALGGFMVTFSNTQHLTAAQDVQGSKAYWAARGGLEWALVSLPATCPAAPTAMAGSPTAIDGFTIVVTCTKNTYTVGTARGGKEFIYAIESIAKIGTVGSVGYVERSVSASVCKDNGTPSETC